MARTESNNFPIGTKAPSFQLPDTVSGRQMTFADVKGMEGTVVIFMCNHCPFVKLINHKIAELAKAYQEKGVNFVAISSNDVQNYPEDAPELMAKLAQEEGFIFPYLYDSTQEVAKAYDAACTPDIYVFDKDERCYYHGQIDDARPGNGVEVTGQDLTSALNQLLEGADYQGNMKPSIGCNIKWKAN